MKRNDRRVGGVLLGTALATAPMLASAGITLYDEGDKSLEIGGRLQAQYKYVDSDETDSADAPDSVDDFFFRRLRFYIEGTVTENIYGIWQVDFSDDSSEPEVKDAFIQYSGLPVGVFIVGNHNVPFSRELLTSSKRQQTVERQFVGDHDFGVPDRQMGISYSAEFDNVIASAGAFQAGIDPSFSKIDFESRVSGDFGYAGNMVAGRIDFNPFGNFGLAEGAFGSEMKLGIGVNGYTWSNDDDVTLASVPNQYDSVDGLGVDTGFKMGYFSAGAGYQTFSGETRGGVVSTGLVDDSGDVEFDTWLAEGGYMIIPNKLEGVLAYSVLDTEKFDDPDKRISIGANYFFNKHNAKIQLTYEIGQDVIDTDGNTRQFADQNRLFLQFQQVI